jgi:protein SCO1
MLALATQAMAHDGKRHGSLAEADNHIQSENAPNLKGIPLPFNLGGPFSLIDQNGNTRTEVNPNEHLQLLFFGYATCREICSVALPQMAEVEHGLAARGIPLTPVLITVDPLRDTVATMGPALRKYSPAFIGLTGDKASLEVAYRAFSIDSSLVFEDPVYGAVYAHGSFLYLLDAQGGFLTVIPPILTTDRVIDLIAGYAPQG